MNYGFIFVVNSVLLGIGLSADAFSVSVVNGSCIPKMKLRTSLLISASFAFFQALMPMTGWFMASGLISCFSVLQKFIPCFSQFLLVYLGIKIITDGRSGNENCPCTEDIGLGRLLLQSVATSVDALLAGLALSEYQLPMALSASAVIAAVTFVICFAGVHLGRLLGTKLLGKASVFGGMMLILIAFGNFFRMVF